MKTLYFAGGCFWGLEKFFMSLPGIINTVVGYANGIGKDFANYEAVCSGLTGFRETVMVSYDERQISTEKLCTAFYSVIDPTMFNRQGFDMGTQYQTGIYYSDANDIDKIAQVTSEEKLKYSEFYTEVRPLENFFPAEEYHQKYLIKNPDGYCHISDSRISNTKILLNL